MLKRICTYLAAPRFLPHLAAWKLCASARAAVDADLAYWNRNLHLDGMGRAETFFYLLAWKREFRNLFLCRARKASKALAVALGLLARPERTLLIECPDIGPGVFIQHGIATIIYARAIGAGCWINQQVTIGYKGPGLPPVLGRDVRVGAGAKVLGDFTVGDGVRIGANAVVLREVPANCTVAGVPARIIKRDGVRADEAL